MDVAAILCGLKHLLCEGALRHRNTRELYSNKLGAVGPNHAQLWRSVEDETEQKQDNKTRQQNKTQGLKQGK